MRPVDKRHPDTREFYRRSPPKLMLLVGICDLSKPLSGSPTIAVVDRLRENTVVTISLPFAGRTYRVLDFEASVVALIESGAVLHPIGVDATVFPEKIDGVFLTFVHEGQLVGLKGGLTTRAGSLRFQVEDGVQRRRSRYTRVDAELPVMV